MSSITKARFERWCTSTLGTQERNTGPLHRLAQSVSRHTHGERCFEKKTWACDFLKAPDSLKSQGLRDQNTLSTKNVSDVSTLNYVATSADSTSKWGCELALNSCMWWNDLMCWRYAPSTCKSSINPGEAAMFFLRTQAALETAAGGEWLTLSTLVLVWMDKKHEMLRVKFVSKICSVQVAKTCLKLSVLQLLPC